MEFMGSIQGKFVCMGSLLVKVLTFDQLQKRGWTLVNRCFLCESNGNQLIISFSTSTRQKFFGSCGFPCLRFHGFKWQW